jgi:F-type H+-transporting ATPase subunit a
MYLTNPFEQFEIILLFRDFAGSIDVSLTNLTLTNSVGIILLILFLSIVVYSMTYLPNNGQIITEGIYLLIYSILHEQTGKKGYPYLPHLATIFLSILLWNWSGLIPFTFTVSSHIVITITIALSYFIAWIIIGFNTIGRKFFDIFCPRNMPSWLLPLLVVVEFLSFCLRPISLGVRLFANMLAGHILLHILAGAFLYLMNAFILLAIPAYAIVTAIGFLELGIGFLQAYIFVLLLAIYLKDSLIAH